MSLAQIIGPVWATTAVHPVLFWVGMLSFTGLSLGILVVGWKRLMPKGAAAPNPPPAPSGSRKGSPRLSPGEDEPSVVAINSELVSLADGFDGEPTGEPRERAPSRHAIN